jgi:hypothetical protein
MQTPRLFCNKRASTWHEVVETDLPDAEVIGDWQLKLKGDRSVILISCANVYPRTLILYLNV